MDDLKLPLNRLVDQGRQYIFSLNSQYICTAIFLILALPFIYHPFFITRRPNGPPFIKGPIPFIGVAFSYLRDPQAFLKTCQERYGDIFTLYMGGKRMHVITDPISALANQFDIVLFGVAEKQAKDKEHYKAQFNILSPLLLPQDIVASLIKEFNSNLQPILAEAIAKLDVDGQLNRDGIVVPLDVWIKKIMFECSGRTLFGQTWPSEPEFFDDYCIWEDDMYMILKNYPYIFTRRAILARERYFKRFAKMFKEPFVNASKLIQERLRVHLEFGYTPEEAARNTLGVLFALQTNAIPASFWMIAYVTCLEGVERNNVLSRIQKQVIANESTKSSTSFNVSDLLKDPVLNSAFSETLRLQINGLSMKGVEQDTTLSVNGQTYTLEKGSIVFISMPGVHKDPEIYENPEQFQLKRFLYLHTTEKDDYDTEQSQKVFTKNGVVVRQPFFPWGGGHFMCTGRKFATGEVILFVSTILNLFEITAVDGGKAELPALPLTERFGGGVEMPARPWRVRIKYRGEICLLMGFLGSGNKE